VRVPLVVATGENDFARRLRHFDDIISKNHFFFFFFFFFFGGRFLFNLCTITLMSAGRFWSDFLPSFASFPTRVLHSKKKSRRRRRRSDTLQQQQFEEEE
jgi:hypothetical protein